SPGTPRHTPPQMPRKFPRRVTNEQHSALASRRRHIELLYEELGTIAIAIATTRTNAEWLAELDCHNIPGMVVDSLETLPAIRRVLVPFISWSRAPLPGRTFPVGST